MNPKKIYNRLYDYFGPQGWWPIFDTTSNKCKYHTIGHLSEPELPSRRPTSDSQKFEICAGAILTQNTAWKNVEGALRNLKTFSHSQEYENVSPKFILSCKNLKHLIQPAGYYNQKAKKLRIFSEFWMNNDLSKIPLTALRLRLTALWGIGPETADSILLYAFNQPIFVIDAYTKRLCEEFGIKFREYDEYRQFFESQLAPQTGGAAERTQLFNEYHALIVAWGKLHAKNKEEAIKIIASVH